MRWRDSLAPVRMERVALVAPVNSMGDALNETFADAGDTAGDKLKHAGDKLKTVFATKPDDQPK